ncbi:nucleotide exchange factor GrpE [bacterium]|nr:nucleotide exchange factor GrpE [bacterium]
MAEEELKEATVPESAADEKDQRLAELEGQYKRLAADFENYRRRQTQEREELVKFAASRVFENLLPVVDNLERAIASSRKATDVQQVLTGVELIQRQMMDFLTKSGVVPMEAQGTPFDPNLHEAIAQIETSEAPDQSVLAEVLRGYYLNGKVLRHAMVQVANNPNATLNTEPKTEMAANAADSHKEDNHG